MDQRIVICGMCGGAGRIETQRHEYVACPRCGGAGTAVSDGHESWAWIGQIDDATILERRMEVLLRGLINTLLFIYTVLGLVLGGRDLISAFQSGSLGSEVVSRSWPMGAFWLALLTGCYLGFRFYRQLTNKPEMPDSIVPGGADEVLALPRRDVLTVADAFVQMVFECAWQMAASGGSAWIQPAHVLAALADRPEIGSMLVRLGVGPSEIKREAVALTHGEKRGNVSPSPSAATRLLLEHALMRAVDEHRTRILLVDIFAAFGAIDDPARELLYDHKVDNAMLAEAVAWLDIQEDLRHRIRRYRRRAANKPKGAMDRGYTAVATPILNQFSQDLTSHAREGRLPYIVARDDEIKAVFRVIESNRRSVVIVGDSGTGKTSILHALAEMMVTEDVPEVLQDKRLVSLSSAALVAGTSGSGQLEARVESILLEIQRAGNIVLAIENFDQLVGASTAGSEGLDAAQIIADAAANRQVLVIATSSPLAYRKYLERGVIPSGFVKIELDELDPARAVRVLQSRVGGLEHRYDVFFTFAALDKAVQLARRYLHQRTLPGSALELLEEAAVLAQHSGRNALVTAEHVAQVVTQRTKVSVAEVTEGEQTRLLQLESILHQRVVGQDEAVASVANALRRARTELRDPRRPISNLLFLGPTGVGKTELAKAVAQVFFGSEDTMIRLDMSEYQEIGSLNRLIGSPPGPGSDGRGGYLSDAVREHPYALVLLDELEKAHPDVLNVFLQVMDDGRLTDGAGRTVDFTNVILIATSNAGTQQVQDRLREGAALATIKEELLESILQKYFRPEFLNRFDAIILFTPLSFEQVIRIVEMMIAQIAGRLADKGITFRASPEAVEELARIGFDPVFGARPLRRAVQDRVDNALARYLLEGKVGRRDVAVLEKNGSIRVEKAAPIR